MPLSNNDYGGESSRGINNLLKLENPNTLLITADSRLLGFVAEGRFELSNVYIMKNKQFYKLQETTKRILREGHNLMKLYESGEFN